jgi:peptidoglycan/LPS O-acetylase OafA/YrhL
MLYRREVDGLRAIAVLPVIFFHAGFEAFSGGFVGVDVFFVISGYLITNIILDELEQGKFSLVKFYERRARRILPALFLVLIACIPFSWILLSPADLKNFSESLIAVPLFISNFYFWRNGGYFETASELKPLLHTWSLSVEEQYYLLFPLFLIIFWKYCKRWMWLTLFIIFCASLAFAHWAAEQRPDLAFYLLPTRGWELLIGVFSAKFMSTSYPKEFSKATSEVSGCIGLALIFFTFFTYRKSTPFPSLYTLAPTLGTALVIIFATNQTVVGKFIGNKLFVSLGTISYSAYLWHQPILAYSRHWLWDLNLLVKSLLILLVIVISILSWKYVEMPFRNKSRFEPKYVLASLFLVALSIIFIGYFSKKVELNNEELMAIALCESEAIYSSNINERIFIKNRINCEKSFPEAIVIGSSRIMQASSIGTGLRLLNLSVSGASLEDLITIWDISSKKLKYDYVFLGADPWIFNLNSGQNRWMSLDEEYNNALVGLGIDKEINISQTKSPSYLNSAANRIYYSINLSKITAEDDTASMIDKIRKDGSRVYNLSYSNKSSSEVERGAFNYISYSMANFSYSSEAQTILERLIVGIKNKNKKIVLVLSPYHPILFELMQSENRKFLEIESKFREIAESSGIELIGSYDPTKVGCSSEDFYDGMHPKDKCINKVFSQLRK